MGHYKNIASYSTYHSRHTMLPHPSSSQSTTRTSSTPFSQSNPTKGNGSGLYLPNGTAVPGPYLSDSNISGSGSGLLSPVSAHTSGYPYLSSTPVHHPFAHHSAHMSSAHQQLLFNSGTYNNSTLGGSVNDCTNDNDFPLKVPPKALCMSPSANFNDVLTSTALASLADPENLKQSPRQTQSTHSGTPDRDNVVRVIDSSDCPPSAVGGDFGSSSSLFSDLNMYKCPAEESATSLVTHQRTQECSKLNDPLDQSRDVKIQDTPIPQTPDLNVFNTPVSRSVSKLDLSTSQSHCYAGLDTPDRTRIYGPLDTPDHTRGYGSLHTPDHSRTYGSECAQNGEMNTPRLKKDECD